LHSFELEKIGKLFSIESFHIKKTIYGIIISCLKDEDGELVYRVLSSNGISYLQAHDFEITFYD
tara:strand:+ start:327 stop:518 length:192 start_codon:yes stop_codon:yes gene_type:complete